MGEGWRADPGNLPRQETGNCRNFFFLLFSLVRFAVWGGWASGAGTVWDDGRQPTALHPPQRPQRPQTPRHGNQPRPTLATGMPGALAVPKGGKNPLYGVEPRLATLCGSKAQMPMQRRRDQRQASCEGTTHANWKTATGKAACTNRLSLSWAETSHRGHHVRFHNNLLSTQSGGPILAPRVREQCSETASTASSEWTVCDVRLSA